MFDDIISLDNLATAWREFRHGKRDRSDVQMFERRLEDNMFALHDELRNRSYRHGFYERFNVFDPKHRIIHKAAVRDRVVHHAVSRILTPYFNRLFIFDSYSCRVGKGTHAAVDRLAQFARRVSQNWTRPAWALKGDIKKFFESIDHRILFQMLARRIPDTRTMWLLREIIESFPLPRERERVTGLPIGNLTSQLFANLYLNEFDHFIKEEMQVPYYIRYTDDFVILHDNPVALVSLLPVMRAFLHDRLALELHHRKISLRKLSQGIDFLGYVTLPHLRLLRTKTKQRMMQKLSQWKSGDFAVVESYLGILTHCNGYALSKRIRQHAHFDECWEHGIMYPF